MDVNKNKNLPNLNKDKIAYIKMISRCNLKIRKGYLLQPNSIINNNNNNN